jgi:hypothetical protein
MNILDIANEIAATGPDLTKTTEGGSGGTRVAAAAGLAQARLLGYIEVGKHEYDAKVGTAKVKKTDPRAILEFELSGPKHPPVEIGEGDAKKSFAHTLREVIRNVSLNEKATYAKLFAKMNWDQRARHFSQLLTKPFRVQVSHWVPNAEKPDEKIAQIAKDGIMSPSYEDAETGESKTINPVALRSAPRLFIWDAAPEHIGAMWDSIFIDGSYTVGEGENQKTISRNYYQDLIRKAKNFEGSPIQQYLAAKGETFLPPKQEAPAGLAPADSTGNATDNDDPLAGM